MGALKGIKVLDLTRVLAGPYATMILADLGAEVIKVERPGSGDDSRSFGPYKNGESGYFMSLNRNKKSITLDLKKEEGKKILREFIKQVDIIVENFRPGTMEKLGFSYEECKKINKGIIYAAASGFGHTGPYSKRPAYDGVVQAMGAVMSITGQKGGEPTRFGPSIGDIAAGMFTSIGILAALQDRNKTGEGQKVDVAMLDCQVAILENAIARYTITGEVPAPAGNRHSSIVPFEPFDTKTTKIMVAAGNDNLWNKFLAVIDRSDLIGDDRFSTNPKRNENYEELREIVQKELFKKTSDEWYKELVDNGIPSGPINTVDKLLEDEQIKSRDMIVKVDHKVAGEIVMPGIPIKLSRTPGSIYKASPVLGEDSYKLLEEYLGYNKDKVDKLKEDGVL